MHNCKEAYPVSLLFRSRLDFSVWNRWIALQMQSYIPTSDMRRTVYVRYMYVGMCISLRFKWLWHKIFWNFLYETVLYGPIGGYLESFSIFSSFSTKLLKF